MMTTPTIKANFDQYSIRHFLDFQSGNEERIIRAAHDLVEGGILHLHVLYLRPALLEFFRQFKEWHANNAPAQTGDSSSSFWNDQLKGIKGIDEE